MYQIVLLIHLFICIALITLVLLQQGKGATAGAGLGAGASSTVFGSQGSSGFLLRVTGGFALAFFVTCLTLGYLVNVEARQGRAPVIKPVKSKPQPVIPQHKK